MEQQLKPLTKAARLSLLEKRVSALESSLGITFVDARDREVPVTKADRIKSLEKRVTALESCDVITRPVAPVAPVVEEKKPDKKEKEE